jgi:hypothetical protein
MDFPSRRSRWGDAVEDPTHTRWTEGVIEVDANEAISALDVRCGMDPDLMDWRVPRLGDKWSVPEFGRAHHSPGGPPMRRVVAALADAALPIPA